jgi:uncharacterized protein (DUF1330 family)
MSVFMIGRMEIHTRDWVEEYFAKVPAIIESFGGRFVVRGGDPSRLEGAAPLPDAVFVLEFPDRDRAEAFWHSDAFAPLVTLRQSGSSLEALLVDCVPEQAC